MKDHRPVPLFEPLDSGDTLTPAEHRAHMAERKAEERTRTTHGYVLEPPGPRRGAVVDRYLANVQARQAERTAGDTSATKVVVLPDSPADPPADLEVAADPDDDYHEALMELGPAGDEEDTG